METESNRYANMAPAEAVEKYLNAEGAKSREQIIAALIAGGNFANRATISKGGPAAQIGKTIKFHLEPRKGKSPSLRQVGDLIGLAEWPDDKFRI